MNTKKGCHKVFKWCLKDALNMLFKHFFPLLNCTHKAILRYIYACLKLLIDVFLPCDKAIVRPQLEYASPVWDPHTKDDIHKIEGVQRRAARWVLGDYSPYSRGTDIIGNLGWPSLEQQHTDSRLVFFYKIIYGYVAIPLPSYVIPLPRASHTSHPLAYRQISTRTD